MARFSGVPAKHVTWKKVDAAELNLGAVRAAVVGGTGGLGRAIARLLAERGADVLVVGRTFRDEGTPRLRFLSADLESMAEAKRVARELPAESLDLLVLTTGIMTAPKREQTAEGVERDLAVSYLSRFAILGDVAERLGRDRPGKATKPRVFVMGFPGTNQAGNADDFGSERGYRAMDAHMNTVAGNEALVLDAARRHTRLNVYGLNPGLIRTDIRSNFLGRGSLRHRIAEAMIGLLTPSAETYARRIVPLLVSPDIESASGMHFDSKANAILPSEVMTEAHVRKLMDASAALLARATAPSPPPPAA